jgi:hypothetical protein
MNKIFSQSWDSHAGEILAAHLEQQNEVIFYGITLLSCAE